jgi:class 3 adenylate cyclase/TolB-like protein/tetratricopeptide (TPR) repeat protein
MATQRRLAAVLAADVVGYSRLMGADEEGTLARLKAHREELFRPKVAEHGGRIVKTTGDGVLVEFGSAVEAVRHAVDVQRAVAGRNVDLPAERRIELRMGINVGDIIIDGDDIYGEGVNIAARLEGLAEPGGICISGAVHDQVRGKVDVGFEDWGERTLKNIARAVRVFRVTDPDVQTAAFDFGSATPLSIVVLPFENLGRTTDEDYFAGGMTEDLTTDLAHLPGTFVISRHTAQTYKDRTVDIRQVGRELAIRYALEGSVQRSGDRIRVNAQLIDVRTGAHLWADRFDGGRDDLFLLQDEIVGRIASALSIELTRAEGRRAAAGRSAHPDAADLVMQGWAALQRPPSKDVLAEARDLFARALQLDPRAVDALIGMANVCARSINSGFTDDMHAELQRGDALVTRALEIDPNRATGHYVRGLILRTQHRLEEAVGSFERAIAINRNYAWAYGSLGDVKSFLGLPEETIALTGRAIRLRPRDPLLANWQFDTGCAYFLLAQDDLAAEWLLKARGTNPKLPFVPAILASVRGMQGDLAAGRAELAELARLAPGIARVSDLVAHIPAGRPAFERQFMRYREGWRVLGMPE